MGIVISTSGPTNTGWIIKNSWRIFLGTRKKKILSIFLISSNYPSKGALTVEGAHTAALTDTLGNPWGTCLEKWNANLRKRYLIFQPVHREMHLIVTSPSYCYFSLLGIWDKNLILKSFWKVWVNKRLGTYAKRAKILPLKLQATDLLNVRDMRSLGFR